MKKFQFHLEKLLSYKGQILDSEIMNLAILNKMLYSANEKMKLLKTENRRYKDEFQNKISVNTSSAECRVYALYAKEIDEKIKLCADEIEKIERQIDVQMGIVKELKIETKSLETIKETKFTEYQKEALKKTEIFIDEFVSRSRIVDKMNSRERR